MSLFGAMNTAVSGLSAQSSAFGNISDNVANSQTVGYKRVDTSFIDYLTTSTADNNVPGSVVTRPDYVNNVEGTITQTDNPLGLAITGQGFFAVSTQAGTANNLPTFDAQQEYTRAGDFQMDKNGYLVNSAGEFLNGWPVTNGVVNQNTLTPIQVSQSVFNPIPTKNVTLSANLPATPTAGSLPITSDINVYDKNGTLHVMTMSWTETTANTPNDWTVTLLSPDDTDPNLPIDPVTGDKIVGTADVQFGATGNPAVPEGTIGNMSGAGGITASPYALNGPATLAFNASYGTAAIPVSQPITINLGTYGGTSGLTQYAGTDYNLRGLTQDGVPPGAFSSVSTATNGDIAVNYDNGQSNVIARVPLVTFNDPNGLQRQNGQAFTASQYSGTPLAETANTNGAGGLVTQSVEGSNVDIATEFSKLIVAQEAYSANTKLVTSADQMLQLTVNMKQ